jgi:glycosyltransferase involved in cell wall biosynthesis
MLGTIATFRILGSFYRKDQSLAYRETGEKLDDLNGFCRPVGSMRTSLSMVIRSASVILVATVGFTDKMSSAMSHFQQKISVALCTYNGERFLSRQLISMQQQTRSPDELVCCDDCSTDSTIEILRDFAASAGFPVRIIQNEHNLGFVANFERAIQLCQGDLIALSDQDDIWDPMRLERSQQEFIVHPEVGLAFSDADIIDDQDQFTGMCLWRNFGFEGERKQRLLAGDYTVLAKNRFVTGATVMFRSRLRENCLPIGSGWLHDEWIAATAAAVADLMPIDSPLIRYRRHTLQQVGLSPASSLKERHRVHWNELSRQIGLLEVMCSKLSQQSLTRRGAALYACYKAHLQFARFRYSLPESRIARLNAMLQEYATYSTLGSGVRSMATDLVLSK